ncbi:MAG: hypothetical protein ACLURV_06295 [Gallintestinimicrobium sp.]
MKKTRQANLELLRLLAMVFVVTAHLMNHGNLIGAAKRGTASYYLVWTLFGVSPCINLYLVISSYFLTESRFSLWKLVKLAVQVLFYAWELRRFIGFLQMCPMTWNIWSIRFYRSHRIFTGLFPCM